MGTFGCGASGRAGARQEPPQPERPASAAAEEPRKPPRLDGYVVAGKDPQTGMTRIYGYADGGGIRVTVVLAGIEGKDNLYLCRQRASPEQQVRGEEALTDFLRARLERLRSGKTNPDNWKMMVDLRYPPERVPTAEQIEMLKKVVKSAGGTVDGLAAEKPEPSPTPLPQPAKPPAQAGDGGQPEKGAK
jgi:hypothetical protein